MRISYKQASVKSACQSFNSQFWMSCSGKDLDTWPFHGGSFMNSSCPNAAGRRGAHPSVRAECVRPVRAAPGHGRPARPVSGCCSVGGHSRSVTVRGRVYKAGRQQVTHTSVWGFSLTAALTSARCSHAPSHLSSPARRMRAAADQHEQLRRLQRRHRVRAHAAAPPHSRQTGQWRHEPSQQRRETTGWGCACRWVQTHTHTHTRRDCCSGNPESNISNCVDEWGPWRALPVCGRCAKMSHLSF